ncbi:MAG: NADH-quinone oxidoreductase subunit C/D [Pseudomonadales bacterium]|nr:NADH-quinone oxidoreductase subunit C/D [Pseudomonadales bacterium]NRA16525.1 NADH-quinone oxidoreductase subunit C/D [Oceanospirillaceae bacterium]
MMTEGSDKKQQLLSAITQKFGEQFITEQVGCGRVLTFWVAQTQLQQVLCYLRDGPDKYLMLVDLYAVDERLRQHTSDQPNCDFSIIYQLLSVQHNFDIRIKLALIGDYPTAASISTLWQNANWYEREIWDMYGIVFTGHPLLKRILTPPTFVGHPLRKEFPCRATEQPPFSMNEEQLEAEQQALKFDPADWGMSRQSADSDFMYLNLGPNHPSVHGVFRIALQLNGERIIDAAPDIGYHHRGAEKIAERQTWHGFIPYTDRIDYLGGVMNNLPYVLAIEQMAKIEVPERAQCIRVMLSECFRILSHMLFYGTFAQDLGQLSTIFYLFIDREKLFGIIEAITGARMHPSWFRIGGVAQDLPQGWDKMIREFIDYFPARLDEYDVLTMENSIIKKRTVGIGQYSSKEALEWGVTGAGLRATGMDFDLRKARPYSGYQQYEFEIPTADNGDCYDRCWVRVQEMRQSLKIIRQCLDNMPAGAYKASHPLTTPPMIDKSKQDIETQIQHFLNVSWGPVMPPAESFVAVEATKGINGYTLYSDGSNTSYRTRIRTPSFPHLQMIPHLSRGVLLPDLIAIIASIDFVMADVDR